MRHVLMSSCLVVAVAAVLVGCSDPTEGISEAQVNAPVQTAAVAPTDAEATREPASPGEPDAPVAGEPAAAGPDQSSNVAYVLTGDSVIGFEGYKVTGSHIGGFGAFDGEVTVPAEGIDAAKIDVTIDMDSTYSDDPGLTTKLKGPDFFDVERFPEARFVSTGIDKTDDGYTVTGDLTLHGVTQNISFPAQITVDREKLVAEAEFTINRMDFGIEYQGMADDLIKEKVVIRLDVEGAPGR